MIKRCCAIFWLVFPLAALLNCQRVRTDSQSSEIQTPLSVEREWQLLTAESGGKLQDGCMPRRIEAQGTRKGVVFLLHGFTACPQQFDKLAEKLSQQGYEVFLPLLPGHGYEPKELSPRLDHSDLLPSTLGGYTPMFERIYRIAEALPGRKIIGGLSLGATLATLAVVERPQLFDAELALVPPFLFSSQFVSLLTAPVDFPITVMLNEVRWADMELSWGSLCWNEEAERGRAGYCKFKVSHVTGVQKLSEYVLQKVKSLVSSGKEIKTEFQFIGGTEDPVISNPTMYSVVELLRQRTKVSLCMYRGGGHSLLSVYDRPFDKPWLGSLLKGSVEFIGQRKNFAAAADTFEAQPICKVP